MPVLSARLLLIAAIALACTGCGLGRPPPGVPVPHAAASFAVWAPLSPIEATSLRGEAIEMYTARGGALVRIEARDAAGTIIAVGERGGLNGAMETWTDRAIERGAATFRVGPFTREVLVRRGAARRVLAGEPSDPGYEWFGLEDRVMAWAEGPLDVPFPQVVARERIDIEGFASLSAALRAAIDAANDKRAATEEASAIRRVAGARAIVAIRAASGYPYFLDTEATPRNPTATRDLDGRKLYRVAPGAPDIYEVDGPALLHLWARTDRSDDSEVAVDLRVFEGAQLRAESGASLPRRPLTAYDGSAREPTSVSLRRAIVHVPPGRHAYRVTAAGGTAWLHALRAEPLEHMEDAITGERLETRQLARAARACEAADRAPLCALAMALSGGDARDPAGFAKMLATSPASVRGAASTLAAGGPRDPTLALELAASRGEAAALAKLGAFAQHTIDDGVREAWVRAVSRGTRWTVSPSESGAESWRALMLDESRGGACADLADEAWVELGAEPTEVDAVEWHGAKVIELFAVAACDGGEAVTLEVDGAPIAANPSSDSARWHVRVRGDVARVRRLDRASGKVFAVPRKVAACGARWSAVRAARRASEQPELSWAPGTTAPGVELWTRAKDGASEITLTPIAGGHPAIRLVARGRASLDAIDERGVRWRRVARAALPAWASSGARVSGSDDVAVRAIVRVARDEAPNASPHEAHTREAQPLDETELVALTREILAAAPAARGPLYLKRAIALARGGASRGAMSDARAARALDARGPSGEDPVAIVRAEAAPRRARVAPLPNDTTAYGVEPDFDPAARRCAAAPEGPRARFEAVHESVAVARKSGATAYDPALATRVAEAMEAAPLDPRAAGLLSRTLSGSRWRLVREAIGNAPRVKRPRATNETAVGGNGELHAHVLAGDPFPDGSYVAVTAERPAKAALGVLPADAKGRVEIVCVPRSPADASAASCPLELRVGNAPPLHPSFARDGRARAELALPAGRAATLTLSLPSSPAHWTALARIVFARKVAGTVDEPGVGWVLEPPHVERRFLLTPGSEIAVRSTSGVLRVDAQAEPGAAASVVAIARGRERAVPIGGGPVVVGVERGKPMTVRATGGAATIAIAERVPVDASETADDTREPPAPTPQPPREAPAASGGGVVLDLDASPTTRAVAERSPEPLSRIESSLGTLVVGAFGVYGTLREGAPSAAAADSDGYAAAFVEYRRRIESLALWTDFAVVGRRRDGAPSAGTNVTLYEDADRIHTRVTATLGTMTQTIDGASVTALKPRAFLEYSWRASRTFFLLPRLGYDGFYDSPTVRPRRLQNVDDDVYNAYRSKRPTFLFAQALAWWTPFFNDIVYVRNRVTYDPLIAELSHVSSRPGVFLAFGDLDIGSFVDATWYAPTESVRSTARIDATGGLKWSYTVWRNLGSFALQPGGAGLYRVNDGGWQLTVFVNVLASYRRGLRDFSSLELDFPEQLGGSIPWRGATPGGYR